MITVLIPHVPISVDNFMQCIGVNILLLTILYFYSIKNLFDKEIQPLFVMVMIPLLSFVLFALNIALAVELGKEKCYISQKAVLGVLFLNFVAIYYLFWIALIMLAGAAFISELLFRLLICRLSRPFNPHIKLPALLYPVLPALVNIEVLIPESNYISSEHSIQDCIICLKVFHEGDPIKQLRCHPEHLFHTDCLHQWLCVKLICPICRAPIT